MMKRITAVFDTQAQAQKAVDELRNIGVVDAHLSFLSQNSDTVGYAGGGGGSAVVDRPVTDRVAEVEGEDLAERTGKGLLGGAGVGALFGLAAVLIPGVGPFIAAGTLATVLGATGGAIAAGAIVGATSGAIAGALTKAGYDEREANWYGSEIEKGRVMVAVDTVDSAYNDVQIREVLSRHGGRNAAGNWSI